MPNQACCHHIEAIILTHPHFNDFLVNKGNKKEGRKTKWREYKKEEYRTHSLIKNPLSPEKTLWEKSSLDRGKECYTGERQNRKVKETI